MSFDTSGIDALVRNLGKGDAHLVRRGRQVLEVSARNLKEFAQATARQLNPGSSKAYPKEITYDFVPSLTRIRIDVGPTTGGQGSLGGVLEDGGIRNRPQNNLARAQRAVERDLERGAIKAAQDALKDALG